MRDVGLVRGMLGSFLALLVARKVGQLQGVCKMMELTELAYLYPVNVL